MSQAATPSSLIREPVVQYSLFGDSPSEAIVNVASVPHRSPFRYPGGKTWLVPKIRRWIASLPARPDVLLEPFAGGATVGLTAVFENLVDRTILVEKDPTVAAVWRTILGGDADWLARRIREFGLTSDSVAALLQTETSDTRELAFQTIVRNRVNHGGILAPGSGQLKWGENGKGLMSRWYPETLARRIENIQTVSSRIDFVEGDGLAVMASRSDCPRQVCFIDPPYTAAGKKAGARLYLHSELDHSVLFERTSALAGDFLMTYDNADGVKDLAATHGFQTCLVPMKNTHHAPMTELLIGRDLSWA